MLGSLILYMKGMRLTMFQLSGFYYIRPLISKQLSLPSFHVGVSKNRGS